MSEFGDEVSLNRWVSAVRRTQFSRTTTSVAMMLASWADQDGANVYPGLARVAVSCKLTYNVAKTSMAELRSAGFIRLVRKSSGRHSADEYRLVLAPDHTERVVVWSEDQVDEAIETMLSQRRGKYTPKHATKPTAVGRAVVTSRVDERPASVDGPRLRPTRRAADEFGQNGTDGQPAAHAPGRSDNGSEESAAHGVHADSESAAHGVVNLRPTPLPPTLQDPPSKTTLQAEDHLPDVLKTILNSLRSAGYDTTADEARAVHLLILGRHRPRNAARYIAKIADDGGLGGYLAEVRAEVAKEHAAGIGDKIEELRQGPACDHGTPGGAAVHPLNGDPLCPLCRRGVGPGTTADETPAPEHHQVAIEWGKTRQAAGMDGPPMPVYTRVIAQAKNLLATGLGMRDLLTLARDAAAQDVDLDTQIRIYSGSTNG